MELNLDTYTTNKISVIIPTYCEAHNIPTLVAGISSNLIANHIPDFEVIVVDDNSPDNTRDICQSLSRQYPSFKLIIRINERGLATAIKKGIEAASGDIIITMDADLSHNPALIPQLIKEINDNKTDIAVASRFVNGHQMHSSVHRVWGSKMLNAFIRTILNIPVKDVTGGFHAMKKNILNTLDKDAIFKGYGDYSFALLYKGIQQGSKVKEIGFTYEVRKNGTSKTKFFKSGISYGTRALKLRLGWN
jgi:dolichol-phosphate mannosyltransferase